MNHPQSNVRRRALSAARTLLVLAIGFVTVQVVLYGTILLVMPGLFRGGDFPVGGALVALLLIEILAGAAGVFGAAMLSGRAVAGHGWALGLILMAFNLWVVTAPDSPWPLAPAVVVVAVVPLQTWAALALARRLRQRRRSHVAADGAGAAESASMLLLALIGCGLLATPLSAAARLSGGYADEGPTPPASWHPVDTVRVAPPTGAAETDRPNVQAAFDAVRSGGTILFASGTYMLGAGARLTVPDVSILGHPGPSR